MADLETNTEPETTPDMGSGETPVQQTEPVSQTEPSTGEEQPDDEPDYGTESMLGDKKKPETEDKPPTGEEATPEQVQAFRDAVKGIDLGDGVSFSDEAFDAMSEPLMKLAGGDASKVEPLVKAYTQFQIKQQNIETESQNNYAKALNRECHKRFGADAEKFADSAREGGYKVFGPLVWDTLRSIPQIGSNPDVIERLAAINDHFSGDKPVVPQTNTPPTPTADLATRMYGNL